MNLEQIYNNYLENGVFNYFSKEVFLDIYNYAKQRNVTFNYCLDYFNNHDIINIIELGTTRSFVDGKFEGCLKTNVKYWGPIIMKNGIGVLEYLQNIFRYFKI